MESGVFDYDSYASCCIDFCIGIYHDIYDEEDTAGKDGN